MRTYEDLQPRASPNAALTLSLFVGECHASYTGKSEDKMSTYDDLPPRASPNAALTLSLFVGECHASHTGKVKTK
jgi:hypothetical protein